MAQQCIDTYLAALEDGQHAGYSEHYIKDMITHQYNVISAIQVAKGSADSGLALQQKILDLRLENQRDGDEEDAFWLSAAEGNLAVSLMANGRAEEARDIIETLLNRPNMKSLQDLYLRNLGIALTIMGQFEQARETLQRTLRITLEMRGKESAEMIS